jgi:hypothetical protein
MKLSEIIESLRVACASHEELEGEPLEVRVPDGGWVDVTDILDGKWSS